MATSKSGKSKEVKFNEPKDKTLKNEKRTKSMICNPSLSKKGTINFDSFKEQKKIEDAKWQVTT